MKEKLCYVALDFDTVLQEHVVSSAPQVVGSFSPLEEFDPPVYNPPLTLYHCILQIKEFKDASAQQQRGSHDSFDP